MFGDKVSVFYSLSLFCSEIALARAKSYRQLKVFFKF